MTIKWGKDKQITIINGGEAKQTTAVPSKQPREMAAAAAGALCYVTEIIVGGLVLAARDKEMMLRLDALYSMVYF